MVFEAVSTLRQLYERSAATCSKQDQHSPSVARIRASPVLEILPERFADYASGLCDKVDQQFLNADPIPQLLRLSSGACCGSRLEDVERSSPEHADDNPSSPRIKHAECSRSAH